MDASKHSAGPWLARDPDHDYSHTISVRMADGSLIATVGNLGATSDHKPTAKRWQRETPANARLIAAAPELVEAVVRLIAEVRALRAFEDAIRAEIGNTNWNVLDLRAGEAEAAITKATGEPT